MTVSSSRVHAECVAARTSAAVFDLSQRAQVEMTGPDAAALLHNLCTNDIKNLPPGRGCEFFLTNNKARVVAHGIAHRLLPLESPVLWLDLDPGSAAKTVAHLNHFVVSEQVEIVDRTGALAHLHVCGPQSDALLGENGPNTFACDRLGLPGFDIVCSSSEAPDLWDRIVKSGAVPAGNEAFDTLRIEAGVPVDGIDIDADRFVVEVGRTKQAICYTKGCYLGQEPIVMARDRGHANRLLLGLKVDGNDVLAAGAKVMHKGQEVGQVTSSVWSPLVGAVIALAYLKRGNHEPGTNVEVAGKTAVVMAPV